MYGRVPWTASWILVIGACGAAPEPSPRSATKAEPPQPSPPPAAIAGPTLSLLVPDAGECEWRRAPVGREAPPQVIVRLPRTCEGGEIAWSPDGSVALVWFAPGDEGDSGEEPASGELFRIELPGGAVTELPYPKTEDPVEAVGLAKDGSAMAFAAHSFFDLKGDEVTYLGTDLDFADIGEGLPAAALAYRLGASGWELVEVARSTTGWDYAPGWEAAEASQTLGPRTASLLDPRNAGDEIAKDTAAALVALSPKKPDDGDGWAGHGTPPVYAWQVTGEFTYPTGLMAWRDASGALVRVPDTGASHEAIVTLLRAGPYALVVDPTTGGRARLYDVEARSLLWSSDEARAVVFWPPAS